MNDYYVYVYIDPRNHEEFYYGKGRGSRKNAHLSDSSDTQKARRIAAIHKAGLKPIIRVIARSLSQHDALLVEKTLLWKLGRQLTNVASGHYADNFRPHNMIHQEIPGFDFANGIFYLVDWKVAVDRGDAKFKRNAGIYTTTHVRASLDGQPKTLRFLEDQFGVTFRDLLA